MMRRGGGRETRAKLTNPHLARSLAQGAARDQARHFENSPTTMYLRDRAHACVNTKYAALIERAARAFICSEPYPDAVFGR